MHTPTGSHPTAISVGAKTGKPIDVEWDAVAFTYVNADQIATKTFSLNGVPVQINTYSYNGSGLLTGFTKEVL